MTSHTSVAARASVPSPRLASVVTSRDGTRLAVQEWGNPEGRPILLIHAWAQSHLGWLDQVTGDLAREHRIVTFDWRGHGNSEKPLEPAKYTDSKDWADDVHAVIMDRGLRRSVLVGWSVGGIVALDYLRHHGESGIAGINLVGAANALGSEVGFSHFGPLAMAHAQAAVSDDIAVAIPAITALAHGLFAHEPPADRLALTVGTNLVVPTAVRGAVLSRVIDHAETIAQSSLPLLVSHGTNDGILRFAAAERAIEIASRRSKGTSTPSTYHGGSHAPHQDDPARLNRELAAFAAKVGAGQSSPP